MNGYVTKELDWHEIDHIVDKFLIKTASNINKVKTNTLEWIEHILDYTDDEKAEIDDLMLKVFAIDKRIEEWKTFYGTLDFGKFLLKYRSSSLRVKKHFENIFNELSVLWAKDKINQLLHKPFYSWLYDEFNLKIYVETIIDSEPNFDFSIYNNYVLDKIVLDVKKHNKS